MPETRPISFLSDFGHRDEFVGVVHGVILRIDPRLTIVDITHEVPRGDVRAGALTLLRAIQYMPPGVCLAVVDPGVGGRRAALAAETPWGHFVGPDNGLMAPAVAMVGGATRFVALEAEEFRLPREGVTFDGRDVFAPAAAVLASGEAALEDLGPVLEPETITPLMLPLVDHREGAVDGEVWWVDRFGNAQTNVSPDDLVMAGLRPGGRVAVRIAGSTHEMEWRPAYGEGSEAIIHVDSYGMVTIAVPGGSAAEAFALREGLSVGFGVVDAAGSA